MVISYLKLRKNEFEIAVKHCELIILLSCLPDRSSDVQGICGSSPTLSPRECNELWTLDEVSEICCGASTMDKLSSHSAAGEASRSSASSLS